MSVALKPLQETRPTTEPRPWNCQYEPSGRIKQYLSREEIARALASEEGTLWVDVDTRDADQVSMLKDVFHFHPLAIDEAVKPESRVKVEEFDQYVLLIIRTVAFREVTDDPYDLDTAPVGKHRLYRLAVYAFVERDERVNASRHCQRTGFRPSSRLCALMYPGITVLAPLAGRRTNQSLPLSEAKARTAACRPVAFNV